MKPEAKQIAVAAKLKGPFVFGSQLMVQQLAECALLLAKDSAGKQSNKTLYLLTVSILKALYLLAVSVLKVQRLLTVKVKIGQQQQLAECALPLLLAKGSAIKQSDKALYLLAVSVLKALYLIAVSCLKALYLSPSTPQVPPSSSRPCTCSPSTPQIPPSSHQALPRIGSNPNPV